jgi:TonB family protein
MSRVQAWLLAALFATAFCDCQAQVLVPDALPEFKYPPIARAAKLQGDVVVRFQLTPEGRATDVKSMSDPAMLQGVAVKNAMGWRFKPKAELPERSYKVTFQFRLDPPDDGQPVTKAVLDRTGQSENGTDGQCVGEMFFCVHEPQCAAQDPPFGPQHLVCKILSPIRCGVTPVAWLRGYFVCPLIAPDRARDAHRSDRGAAIRVIESFVEFREFRGSDGVIPVASVRGPLQ